MFDSAATHLVMVATPVAVGGSELLHAAMDPLVLFLLAGAGVLFAALCYGIHSSWKDETSGAHRLYSEEEDAPGESPAAGEASRTLPGSTPSAPDVSRGTTKLAS